MTSADRRYYVAQPQPNAQAALIVGLAKTVSIANTAMQVALAEYVEKNLR